MAYTYEEIVRAYQDVHVGRSPTPAMQDNYRVLASLSAAGQVSDAQILSNLVNSADDSTAVAILGYQFFTGKSPTQAGMAYLVNSPVNPNDLNDPYYARFNIENRYINFAANLGVNGEGAAAFAAKYGAMDFSTYVASIYQTIVGGRFADAAGIDVGAAVAYLVGTRDALLTMVREAGMVSDASTPREVDIAVKAAMAGLVMAASIKADVGLYAAAANNFMVALATNTATYNTDITRTYAPEVMSAAHGTGKAVDRDVPLPQPAPVTPPAPAAPTSYVFHLAGGGDRFSGGGLDDVFNATSATSAVLGAGDVLDGGAGQDTLNITDLVGQHSANASAATVRNIETVNLQFRSTQGMSSIDLSGWTGVDTMNLTGSINGGSGFTLENPTAADLLARISNFGNSSFYTHGGHDVTLNLSGVTGGDIGFNGDAPTGAVAVTLDHNADAANTTSGRISLNAGGNVSLTQTASNGVGSTAYLFTAAIKGGAATTSVVVRNAHEVAADGAHAGVAFSGGPPSVSITDVNVFTSNLGVITSIDIDGYSGVQISASGLTTLKLAHGRGNVTIGNSNVAGAPTALNLSLNAVKDGSLTLGTGYTTLHVTTGAIASRMDNIHGLVTTLNVSGGSLLTLTAAHGLSSLQTVTVTGAAGINADLSGGTVTAIDASATTGDNTVKLDARNATYAGGSGVDRVTLTTGITKVISLGGGDDFLDTTAMAGSSGSLVDGGAGTADVVRMTTINALTVGHLFTNFERLELVGGGGYVLDVQRYDHVTISGGNGMALTGVNSGDTLVLNGAGVLYSLSVSGDRSLNVRLIDGSGAGVNFASSGLEGLETVNLTVTDDRVTPDGSFMDEVTFRGNDLKTLTIDGNAGLNLTATSTALTSVDASGLALGGFTWTTGALTAAAIVKGSATGTNTLNFTASSHGATYTGGTGADIITVGLGANTIDVGIDSSVDRVNVRNNSSLTDFTTIINLAAGDQVKVPGAGSDPSLRDVLDATPSTLMATIEANSKFVRPGGWEALMFFIRVEADTYVYVDRIWQDGYRPEYDVLVKLTGVTLTSANYDSVTSLITI